MVRHTAQSVGLELYREGEKVPATGAYVLVTDEGDCLDYDPITLDEGETFPDMRPEVQVENFYFMLNELACQSVQTYPSRETSGMEDG